MVGGASTCWSSPAPLVKALSPATSDPFSGPGTSASSRPPSSTGAPSPAAAPARGACCSGPSVTYPWSLYPAPAKRYWRGPATSAGWRPPPSCRPLLVAPGRRPPAAQRPVGDDRAEALVAQFDWHGEGPGRSSPTSSTPSGPPARPDPTARAAGRPPPGWPPSRPAHSPGGRGLRRASPPE